ncbi:SEC63 protein, partial [Polypterus senegalus]
MRFTDFIILAVHIGISKALQPDGLRLPVAEWRQRVSLSELSLSATGFSDSSPLSIDDSHCQALSENFTQKCNAFVNCTLRYAQPVGVCLNCYKEFYDYKSLYGIISSQGASIAEIKRQYRLLSLKFHPDKGGDEKMFMRISKAHEALTDEESRKNWEMYGNPDGPQATSFGIALPAWIVDQKNSMLVLLVYGLAFMVILPVVVGDVNPVAKQGRECRDRSDGRPYIGRQAASQQRGRRWDGGRNTASHGDRAAGYVRLEMVLTAAFEFDPRSNKEAIIRPTDNTEVPQLIRELGNINVKKKEPPFCYPYSLKARVLLLSHLNRMEVSENVEEDQRFVVRKSPALLQEMVNVGCQLTMMANSRGGIQHAPRLASIENCMKLSQMIVQGLQESKSHLLQLPHFEEEHLRYCVSKKYKVRSIQDLVSLKDADRRNMLRFLGEEKYEEVMAVIGSFPHINMDIKLQVLDDEDSNNITAGSIVTVTVTLTRRTMMQGDPSKNKSKVWQSKNKGTKKVPKSKKKKLTKKKPPSQQQPQKQDKQKQLNGTVSANDAVTYTKEEEEDVSDKGSDSEDIDANKDSPSEREDESDKQSETENDEIGGDDEEEKQEWWWLYIADRKEQTLISMPYHVCTLKETEEVELKFPAPSKPGNYQYSVILKSDSYMGLDMIKPLKGYTVPIIQCEEGMKLRGRDIQDPSLPWISNVLGVQSVRLRLRLDRRDDKGKRCWQLVDLGGGSERRFPRLRSQIQLASSQSKQYLIPFTLLGQLPAADPMSIPATSAQKQDNSEMQSSAMSPSFIPGQRGKIPGRKRGRPPLRSTVSKVDFQNRYSESLSPLKVPKKRGRKPGFKLKSRIMMTPLAISPPSSTPEPDMSSIPQDAATVPHSATPQVLTVCIYINKQANTGPNLDRKKVQQLPDHFGPDRPSVVLQQAVQACIDCAFQQKAVFSLLTQGYGGEKISATFDGKQHLLSLPVVNSIGYVLRFLKKLCRSLHCENLFSDQPFIQHNATSYHSEKYFDGNAHTSMYPK